MSDKIQHDGLRTQLLDAMYTRLGSTLATEVFDCDLWPVLEKAIEAGELLVWRNTQPVVPVPEAITTWLKAVVNKIDGMRPFMTRMSRKEALNLIIQLHDQAKKALEDSQKA